MTTHISARLAWHMDGWNGRICADPAANTYCIGRHSYPGELIAERRDLDWEQANAGSACATTDDGVPPCMYSVNAFGPSPIAAWADTPDFFQDRDRRRWQLPPATVCVWPYEAMYADDVRKPTGPYDYDIRLKRAREFFAAIEANKSLVFYYANYSNPFSEEDSQRYIIVGLSRIKLVGQELFYDSVGAETRQKYGGAFIWQRSITSHYPDQGLRLPYHRYLDQPDVLDQVLLVPENTRNFKYATRHISDDDALVLVERLIEITGALQQLGDTSENWPARLKWLHSVTAELWQSRGAFPGLTKILDYLDFGEAVPFVRASTLRGQEREACEAIFAFMEGRSRTLREVPLTPERASAVQRQWRLKSNEEQRLLRGMLPRFDLTTDQLRKLLSAKREEYSIQASLEHIGENPYVISEQFVGIGPDDTIPFSKIDHGTFPSPELGQPALYGLDDWRRLRALSVEELKRETRHTFVAASTIVHEVNRRLSFLPEWKRHQFTEKYFEVDEAELSQSLQPMLLGGRRYLYLKQVHEAERDLERTIRGLAKRPDITFKSPVTEGHWRDYLFSSASALSSTDPTEYEQVIAGQIAVCQKIFVRPISVVTGAAGTGKTHVIRALIQAIEKAHGTGASFRLLAPTGKAADRIREATGKSASTIHSFLAERGWLNENFTFKPGGGKKEDAISTYIVDEASMLDLELAAALVRSINWASVQRLILVGDENQLPPIGRGRVFADVLAFLVERYPESVGELETNVRQMNSRLSGKGTGILDLASLFVHTQSQGDRDPQEDMRAEQMLARVQEGGDVDKDLRVVYWSEAADLHRVLEEEIVRDMMADTGSALNLERPYELWRAAWKGNSELPRAEYHQVLSPYRGEEFGTEHLNSLLQERANGRALKSYGEVDGITLFDKVIQIRNRPRSNRIGAYDFDTRQTERIEIYNGELGFTTVHGFDSANWRRPGFRMKRFQVKFARKQRYGVGYGRDLSSNAKRAQNENVEENLDLGYAISVHKSQGSEFERVYFVVPKDKRALLSTELFYTGLTRAQRHCTVFVQRDIEPILSMRRPEQSALIGINSSLFIFRPVAEEWLTRRSWYEEGKIHRVLSGDMVRSKSEVIIANILSDREIPFLYEVPLYAPDGTFYLPDFTVTWAGDKWYWEHLGRMDDPAYRAHQETKKVWYDKHFPGHLITTVESGNLSPEVERLIETHFN